MGKAPSGNTCVIVTLLGRNPSTRGRRLTHLLPIFQSSQSQRLDRHLQACSGDSLQKVAWAQGEVCDHTHERCSRELHVAPCTAQSEPRHECVRLCPVSPWPRGVALGVRTSHWVFCPAAARHVGVKQVIHSLLQSHVHVMHSHVVPDMALAHLVCSIHNVVHCECMLKIMVMWVRPPAVLADCRCDR